VLTVVSKPVEARGRDRINFFLTRLPWVHWIQMRWTALVLGISSNLFDCTLNKISKEHIDDREIQRKRVDPTVSDRSAPVV